MGRTSFKTNRLNFIQITWPLNFTQDAVLPHNIEITFYSCLISSYVFAQNARWINTIQLTSQCYYIPSWCYSYTVNMYAKGHWRNDNVVHLVKDSTKQHRQIGCSGDEWAARTRWRSTARLLDCLPRHPHLVTAHILTRRPSCSASTHQLPVCTTYTDCMPHCRLSVRSNDQIPSLTVVFNPKASVVYSFTAVPRETQPSTPWDSKMNISFRAEQ